MVPRTGIEPVTQGFSVLCSTNWAIEAYKKNKMWNLKFHINILSFNLNKKWRPGTDSNRRPPPWQGGVLTNWTTRPKI